MDKMTAFIFLVLDFAAYNEQEEIAIFIFLLNEKTKSFMLFVLKDRKYFLFGEI